MYYSTGTSSATSSVKKFLASFRCATMRIRVCLSFCLTLRWLHDSTIPTQATNHVRSSPLKTDTVYQGFRAVIAIPHCFSAGQEQRQLGARYEKLVGQRSSLKGLANKSRYKEAGDFSQDWKSNAVLP